MILTEQIEVIESLNKIKIKKILIQKIKEVMVRKKVMVIMIHQIMTQTVLHIFHVTGNIQEHKTV